MKPECKKVLEKAFLYIDGEVLSIEERRTIEVHLKDCAPCFERLGLEQEVTHLLTRLHGANPCPNGLRSRIIAIIEER